MTQESVAGVFQLHGVTRDGLATRDFGSWWEAARHDARTQIERWVLTTSVVSPRDGSGMPYSYMLAHGEDTLVTCNGVLLVVEGATLEAVKVAWLFACNTSVQEANRVAMKVPPTLPTFGQS